MALLPRRLDLLNKTFTAAGLRVIRDIPFGQHPRQKLDIYRPAEKRSRRSPGESMEEPLPVIVFFYGSVWQFGTRQEYEFIGATLAKQGFVVVIPDYRLFPEVIFPRFMDDNASAVAWVMKNIAQHGGDDKAVFLMGHSSGGYSVVMLALELSHLANVGVATEQITGVIGLAGLYQYLNSADPLMNQIFPAPMDQPVYQPVSYVRPGAPPMLLLHGGKDVLIEPSQTVALAARLKEAGNIVESRIYPRLGHNGTILGCLPHFAWRGPVLQDVLNFVTACRSGEFGESGAEGSVPALR